MVNTSPHRASPSPLKQDTLKVAHGRVSGLLTKKLKTSSGNRRNFGGRVFPKASIRKLVAKGSVERSSKNVYKYIDHKLFNMIQKIMSDACAITVTGRGTGGLMKNRTIKERHMVKALSRYHGSFGLASDDARMYTNVSRSKKLSPKTKKEKKAVKKEEK